MVDCWRQPKKCAEKGGKKIKAYVKDQLSSETKDEHRPALCIKTFKEHKKGNFYHKDTCKLMPSDPSFVMDKGSYDNIKFCLNEFKKVGYVPENDNLVSHCFSQAPNPTSHNGNTVEGQVLSGDDDYKSKIVLEYCTEIFSYAEKDICAVGSTVRCPIPKEAKLEPSESKVSDCQNALAKLGLETCNQNVFNPNKCFETLTQHNRIFYSDDNHYLHEINKAYINMCCPNDENQATDLCKIFFSENFADFSGDYSEEFCAGKAKEFGFHIFPVDTTHGEL